MGKLILHIVENGNSYNIDCDECTIVDELQKIIESSYGISVDNQLLLCFDQKMDPQTPLSAYKLPSDEGEVFLFNKSRMRSNSPNPEPEKLHVVEIPDPPIASPSHHPLDDASDPALRALPSYEKEFRYHFQCGKAIYSRAMAKFEACEGLLRKQKVQERALEIARGNVEHFFSMIVQNYAEFDKCYSQQYGRHTNLLKNFQRDVDRLRSIQIVPSLQRDNRKCLLDFFKEESLRRAVVDCSSSRKQFDGKVLEFKQEFGDLKRSAEQLFSERPLFVKGLDSSLKEHRQHINELKRIMQLLSNDVNKVKKLLDDCISPQLSSSSSSSSSSLRPHDAVSALGQIYDTHKQNYLQKMANCEAEISSLLTLFESKKNETNLFVHSYLQKVACVQYNIKDVRYKFSVFHEALKHQDSQFEQLRVVRGVGHSYRACLAEVVRRRSAMKIYLGKAGQLAEELAAEREKEITRREEFLKKFSKYIPGDVLGSMGLFDSPSPCDFNVAPFDTNLLDLEIADIDRFAPELGAEVYGSSQVMEISGTDKVEVENTVLRAELASKVALICLMRADLERESIDQSKFDDLLRSAAEGTTYALHQKDEYQKHLQSLLGEKQSLCEAYEKRIQELEQRLSEGPKISDDEGGRTDRMVDSSSALNSRAEEAYDDLHGGDKEKALGETSVETELEAKAEESSELDSAETKVVDLNDEISKLRVQLEMNKKLLDESQMKCAHLEKCLHEAREEAQRHLSTADRRASDYNVLRLYSVKMRALFERLESCVSSANAIDFVDSLRCFAQSLSSPTNESEDQSTAEFLECVRVLSDKVDFLTMQHRELSERSLKLESANERLNKELNEKKDLVSALYAKHQTEKQANKEKISFGRFELLEIAAFVTNNLGHYEAINRACPYYYLSEESVELFSDKSPARRPGYIVGQIVHIERKVVKSLSSNPYGVPLGCEYFVVTIAMLPEINVGSTSAHSS